MERWGRGHLGARANGSLPWCPSFLTPKRKRKSATVSMRWTPTRAAALDPGSAATYRRPTQALGGLSKEWIKMALPESLPCARGGAAQRRRGCEVCGGFPFTGNAGKSTTPQSPDGASSPYTGEPVSAPERFLLFFKRKRQPFRAAKVFHIFSVHCGFFSSAGTSCRGKR